jgi:transcriptional regulator with XRE-family HTH domain
MFSPLLVTFYLLIFVYIAKKGLQKYLIGQMNIGKVIAGLRNTKGWSQSDLAAKSGISRVMIGKYERDEAVPSIEAAKKIAEAFEVSLDYLAGEGINDQFDKKTIQRMREIEDLNPAVKEKLFFLIDTILRDTKAQKAYAHS